MDMNTFPLTSFRTLYPEFNDVENDVIYIFAEKAKCYLTTCRGVCTNQLWLLVVAHLLYLRKQQAEGNAQTGAIASASIDKVSVSFVAPQSSTDTAHWFNLSPYGMEYLALIHRCGSSPFYVGSMPERSAFRSVGGRFPNRGRIR
ncbi:MAG: DUF4054 domain-containing protein [Enterobacteriaceae bacterium]|jgi:hypothetical protein|nr:DUF4054 domain-containing protein [Enterobacteriaceae bacterium]